MGRLAERLFLMLVVFSAAMALIPFGIFSGLWGWSVVGAALVVVFLGLGGVLVPRARRHVPEHRTKEAGALVQVFGSLCAAQFFVMGLVCWDYGNRYHSGNDGYEALGLIIFLGLLAVGVQGVVATFARLAYVWDRSPSRRGSPA